MAFCENEGVSRSSAEKLFYKADVDGNGERSRVTGDGGEVRHMALRACRLLARCGHPFETVARNGCVLLWRPQHHDRDLE